MEQPAIHSHTVTPVGYLIQRMQNPALSKAEKVKAVEERIIERGSQIVGGLRFILESENDTTAHNVVHLMLSGRDDQELRTLASNMASDDLSIVLAHIEQGLHDAGARIQPKLGELEGEERGGRISALIRYVQHLLAVSEKGDSVRRSLRGVLEKVPHAERHADMEPLLEEPAILDLFVRIEKGIQSRRGTLNPELPALREMLEHYSK